MRSRRKRESGWLVASCATLLLQCAGPPVRAASSEPPSDAAVARAIEALRADPNLAPERQARRLRWRDEETLAPPAEPPASTWLSWLASAGRVAMWLAVAAVLVAIVIGLMRYTGRARRPVKTEPVLPTHVQDLDIRPEALPDDIGGAALRLWQRGERRAGLALLYRGLLSRLVHGYAVPIKASSTEGDCVLLVGTHLTEPSRTYAQQLVQVWQRAVYGASDPDDAVVRALCEGFATVLPSPAVRP